MIDVLALLAGLVVGLLVVVALVGLGRREPLRVAGAAPAAGPTPPAAPPPPVRYNPPRPAPAASPPPPAPMPPAPDLRTRARLARSDGSETIDLDEQVVTIGRGTDQRLRIPDSRASRAHAIVRPRPKGGWELKDVGSANGTQLNGHTIPEGRVAPLRHGDRIGIGPVTITYSETSDGSPPSDPGPAPGPDPTRVI